jgi:hypothetical protein
MTLPSGSEQILSLAWALENVGGFTDDDAVTAVCDVLGTEIVNWKTHASDASWFIGDRRWNSREQIEAKWNARFAILTNAWLNEDAWHTPLWRLWLSERRMVFAANLAYLIKLQGRGTVARLAKFVGRSKTTASKWGRWKDEGRKVRIPPSTVVPRVKEFFGLSSSCDLYSEPLFLGRTEIRDALLRIEGTYRLSRLSGEHLYHAVNRLRE